LAGMQDGNSTPSAVQYTEQAIKVARGGTLIDSIVVGTLAEHGVAQWRTGDRR
jgi:hypothetical protein